MEKGQIVFRLFVPTNQQTAKAIHPRMTPFHHPAPGLEASFSLDRLGFFSSWTNMGRKAELTQDVAYLVVVIALVQAHSLRLLLCRLWTLDHDALDRRSHQFHIVAIGSLNAQADGDPMSLRE